jgi:MFS family permease
LQHYVFDGDAIQLGNFQGVLGTMAMAVSYVSIGLIGWISMKSSKRTAMVTGLGLATLGTALTFFAMDPRWPWLMFATYFISSLGLQGCWLMIDSMTADVCDDDELSSGRRREGMFSAVKVFATKAGQGLTFSLGGYGHGSRLRPGQGRAVGLGRAYRLENEDRIDRISGGRASSRHRHHVVLPDHPRESGRDPASPPREGFLISKGELP